MCIRDRIRRGPPAVRTPSVGISYRSLMQTLASGWPVMLLSLPYASWLTCRAMGAVVAGWSSVAACNGNVL
eukprot:14711614-Alexandrium_andersonii.AAC.1